MGKKSQGSNSELKQNDFAKTLNKIVNATAKLHNIKIDKNRFDTYEGRANYQGRFIRIPKINDIYCFMIALHEIGHLVEGPKKINYHAEYAAEKWAINVATSLNIACENYIKDAKFYVLSYIARAFNKGHNLNSIPNEIREFVKDAEPELESWTNYSNIQVLRDLDTNHYYISKR